MRLMRRLDRERLLQRALTRRGQMQAVGTPTAAGLARTSPWIRVVDRRHEIGALDPEGRANPCPGSNRAAATTISQRELAGPGYRSALRADEIGEYEICARRQHVPTCCSRSGNAAIVVSRLGAICLIA